MSDTPLQRALVHELEMIWLEDIAEMDYVRQGAYLLRGRSAAPPRVAGERRMVGYATVGREVRRVGGQCLRRVFWLKTYEDLRQGAGSGWPLCVGRSGGGG
jgi:hypothetical protein